MITAPSEESSLAKPPCTKLRTRIKTSLSSDIVGHSPHNPQPDFELILGKIELVTTGLLEYVSRQLTDLCYLSAENTLTIVDFILTQKTEINISDTYKLNMISSLVLLSNSLNHKSFRDMKRDDILIYLDSLRKDYASDPLHKWIGSYNVKRQRLITFFRWLYNADQSPSARQTPEFMKQIPILKRKEQSIYKPTDLWTNEDDILFLKYCPSKRDKCYHAVSRDTSGRPHELLSMKIRSIVFKATADSKQYAEVLINGKTGSRSIPLFDSIPYIKDWINSHPQPGNSNALLFPSLSHRTFGRKLTSSSLGYMYSKYKTHLPHKDLRRARAATMSIIPTTTGAAKAIGVVIPELNGKIDGTALRVPVPSGSITDIVLNLRKEVTRDEINEALREASKKDLKGILSYTDEPIVSSDIIGDPHSSIVDGLSTMTLGNKNDTIKVLSWYDNEWGFSCRLVDLIKLIAKKMTKHDS